ncbi:hypothetical protein H2508_09735 [Parahaliea sp. F7430]|uniref:Uncharacterized protein n=1 Tax=Sediminihaliea albiluteola TaxID=2758564 RepID=A0A7W2YJQ6_9GAMM|nr:hypothetical protein [Sediminihaliea albiluteola]MBA6413390.1 hypothetical protein [Sediminihaliea albiluteola]
MRKMIWVLMLTLAAASVHADEAFLIDSKIFDEGNLISSPAMAVIANSEASISEGEKYMLKLTLSPVDEHTAQVNANLVVDGKQFTPSLLLEYDEEASISSGGTTLLMTVRRIDS